MESVVSTWVQEDEVSENKVSENKWLYKQVYTDKIIAYKVIRMVWMKLGLRDDMRRLGYYVYR